MMLTGWPPFNGDTDEQIIKAIQREQPAFNPDHWSCMPLAKHLVAQMLTREPGARIRGPEILAHPWMKQFECGVTSQDLPKEITSSLRVFSSMQLFTRLAHQAAAVSLNPSEVGGICLVHFIYFCWFACSVVFSIDTYAVYDSVDMIVLRSSSFCQQVTALRKAFLNMDRDDSGSITIDEFRSGMKGKLDDAAIDAIFAKIDVNNDGDISYTEFLTASSASHLVCLHMRVS